MFNRKLVICLILFILLPVLLLLLRFGAGGWQASSLQVSPQTTVIKGPLGPNGYPDYVAALNDLAGDGVTPENNAAVLLIRALGPPDVPLKLRDKFYKRLGMPRPNEPIYFVNWQLYFKSIPQDALVIPTTATGEPVDRDQFLNDVEERASDGPWTRSQYPQLAKWLDANQVPLELVEAASRRPRYYAPLVSNDNPPTVYSTLLPLTQSSRDAAVALHLRAMLRLGEKQYRPAWDDLMACRRLGRLVGQGPMLVEALVGYAIEGLAVDGQAKFLAEAELTADQWAALQRQLDALPPRATVVDKIDRGERYGGLDMVLAIARHGPAALNGLTSGNLDNPLTGVLLHNLDWNVPLATLNEWIDRFVAVARIEDRQARRIAAEKLEADMQAMVGEVSDPWGIAGAVVSRRRASEKAGELLVGLIAPSMGALFHSESRMLTNEDLLAVGIALAKYKATFRKYPDKLDELSPDFLKAIPTDDFAGTPLVYQKRDNGYLLYSLGDNQKDEGGSGYDQQADDQAIEVPLPTKAVGTQEADAPDVQSPPPPGTR
jgi:hypothetical protein